MHDTVCSYLNMSLRSKEKFHTCVSSISNVMQAAALILYQSGDLFICFLRIFVDLFLVIIKLILERWNMVDSSKTGHFIKEPTKNSFGYNQADNQST